MKKWLGLLGIITLCTVYGDESLVHSHESQKKYSMYGNCLQGIATKAMGAKQFEVWKSSIAVVSNVPLHVHDTEEVFIVLKGKILAIVGGQEIECIAPATLICPANVPHQLINIGDEPTEQILVLGIDSKICDSAGDEMRLPWRGLNTATSH